MEKKSYIYLISNGVSHKVGVSVDPKKRIKQLQTGSPEKLEIVEMWELPKGAVYKLEKECHNKICTYYPKRGEWFKGGTDFHLRILIEEICEKYLY